MGGRGLYRALVRDTTSADQRRCDPADGAEQVCIDDNRTAGYRICGSGKAVRVECRDGGSDLNPYLAFAAQIAAGISGIENKMELEPEFKGDAYAAKKAREIPSTLRDAAVALKKSKMLRAAMGDEVVEHYVHAAEWEQFEYDRRVTDWEIARGFERS